MRVAVGVRLAVEVRVGGTVGVMLAVGAGVTVHVELGSAVDVGGMTVSFGWGFRGDSGNGVGVGAQAAKVMLTAQR